MLTYLNHSNCDSKWETDSILFIMIIIIITIIIICSNGQIWFPRSSSQPPVLGGSNKLSAVSERERTPGHLLSTFLVCSQSVYPQDSANWLSDLSWTQLNSSLTADDVELEESGFEKS